MTDEELIASCIHDQPEQIGIAVGFKDLKPIHGEWIREMVFGDGDYTLMAHRGAFKSSCLAVAIALIMVLFPMFNIIFLRKADNDVTEMIGMVKKILLSDWIRDIVYTFYNGLQLILTEDTKDHISTNLWKSPMGAPQLLGIGLKSSITGKHAMIVITDDICNINDRVSRAEREKTKLQFQELQNIRNPGGRIINLGTKWHIDDVFTLMDNIHEYDYKKTGLLSSEQVQKIKSRMIPSLFACNYELKIIASEDVIFTSPNVDADPELAKNGIMHVDAAYYGEDYTAWGAMKKKAGKYYLFGKIRRKHITDCYAEIIQDYQRFLCEKLYIEENADKGFVAKELRSFGIRVSSYSESTNKHVKITNYLKTVWDDLYFVNGTDAEYIDQICDYNDEAEHDDAPDNASCLVRILFKKTDDQGGYKSIFGGMY